MAPTVKREAEEDWFVEAGEFVVQVRCLRCDHRRILSDQELADFDIRPETAVAMFVEAQSVIASRISGTDPILNRWLKAVPARQRSRASKERKPDVIPRRTW
jgi:hypothetical protein